MMTWFSGGSYQSWREEPGWQPHDGLGSVCISYAASTKTIGRRRNAGWHSYKKYESASKGEGYHQPLAVPHPRFKQCPLRRNVARKPWPQRCRLPPCKCKRRRLRERGLGQVMALDCRQMARSFANTRWPQSRLSELLGLCMRGSRRAFATLLLRVAYRMARCKQRASLIRRGCRPGVSR